MTPDRVPSARVPMNLRTLQQTILLLTMLLVASCGPSPNPTPIEVCTPACSSSQMCDVGRMVCVSSSSCVRGSSIGCVCPNGAMGAQVCNSTGSGYDPCACSSVDAGVSTIDTGPGRACEPGRSVTCACPGGASGAQTCTADGSGYSPCACSSVDAGSPIDTGPGRVCEPGRSVTCACPGGASGAQTCTADGSGYSPCACAPVDAGSPDVGPVNPCAMGNSCGGCTAINGCGWCGARNQCVQTSTCAGPEVSACGSTWACFPSDCPGSTDCRSCTTNADCPSGQCLLRNCDGARVCVPQGRPAICNTINGARPCPVVPAYRRCSSSIQCGPGSACLPVYPGDTATVCAPSCNSIADCPGVPGGIGFPYCATTERRCYLGCNAAGTCSPDGLTCRRNSTDGAYSYCL